MATIKSYTDINQSRKLAEILSPKSADMWYEDNGLIIPRLGSIPKEHTNTEVPVWSLAALLNVLPFQIITNNQRYVFNMVKGLNRNGETYAIKYTVYNTPFYFHITDFHNNPVDACVAMIEKLHELKML